MITFPVQSKFRILDSVKTIQKPLLNLWEIIQTAIYKIQTVIALKFDELVYLRMLLLRKITLTVLESYNELFVFQILADLLKVCVK